MSPKVLVLMSSYNGEKYIRDQIISIFQQENVDIKLLIRDDGSTDKTIEIINELKKDFNIELIVDKNIGWKKSFISLISIAPNDFDYYAFSDQDDIWLNKKICSGIDYIESYSSEKDIKCYCSSQTFVDENLNPLDYVMKKRFKRTNKYHCITNGFGMGCTMIFNKELLMLLKTSDLSSTNNISHDLLVSAIATYFGTIIRDTNSYMLYRQHSSNSGTKHESFSVKVKKKNNYIYVELAEFMKNNFSTILSNKDISILNKFTNMSKLKNKLLLIFNRYVSRDTFFGTLKLKYSILKYKKCGE